METKLYYRIDKHPPFVLILSPINPPCYPTAIV